MEIFLSSFITGICQFFLIFRVKVISDRNWWIVSILAAIASAQFVMGLVSGSLATQVSTDVSRFASEYSNGDLKLDMLILIVGERVCRFYHWWLNMVHYL